MDKKIEGVDADAWEAEQVELRYTSREQTVNDMEFCHNTDVNS